MQPITCSLHRARKLKGSKLLFVEGLMAVPDVLLHVMSMALPANQSNMQPMCRLQSLLGGSKPDAGMATALPPGAWWEHASNMSSIVVEPYGADAGDAAVLAARSGPLQLQNVCFTYPLRPSAHGEHLKLPHYRSSLLPNLPLAAAQHLDLPEFCACTRGTSNTFKLKIFSLHVRCCSKAFSGHPLSQLVHLE